MCLSSGSFFCGIQDVLELTDLESICWLRAKAVPSLTTDAFPEIIVAGMQRNSAGDVLGSLLAIITGN